MQRDVQLPLQPKSGRHLVSRQPAREQLHSAWNIAVTRGWLDHSSARTIHCLVDTAGSGWLVSAVLSELLQLRLVACPLKKLLLFYLVLLDIEINYKEEWI